MTNLNAKVIGDILLQKTKISEDINWGGHVIHPMINGDYYSVEVDGGTTIIPEMGKEYHCFNVTTKKEGVYEYQGPEDQGFDEADVIWTPIEGSDYREQTLIAKPGRTFTVDTGFYGKVKFQVMSLEAFCNLPEPEPIPEQETAPEVTHIYTVRKNDVDGSVNIFIKTVDGNGVACITCTSGMPTRTDTWKVIFTEYQVGITNWDCASLLNILTKSSDNPENLSFFGSQIGDNTGVDLAPYKMFKKVSLEEFQAKNYWVEVWEHACRVPVTNIGYQTWAQQSPKPFIVPCF